MGKENENENKGNHDFGSKIFNFKRPFGGGDPGGFFIIERFVRHILVSIKSDPHN